VQAVFSLIVIAITANINMLFVLVKHAVFVVLEILSGIIIKTDIHICFVIVKTYALHAGIASTVGIDIHFVKIK
jgi:hypothetical protein